MMGFEQITPIGLDVGGRWIKAVQLRRTGAKLRVVAAARFQRSSEKPTLSADEVARAAEVLARNGFLGTSVVIPLPAASQVSCAVRLPPRESGAPLDQIALSQLAESARMSPELVVGTWWEAPTGGTPKETVGFALGGRRKEIEAMLDAFEGSGLEPVAIDARPCALVRACAPLLEGGPAMTATIDIGSASGTLCVVHTGRLVYERTLPEFGTSSLRQTLARELELEIDVADYLLSRIGLAPPGEHLPEGRSGDALEVVADAQVIIAESVAAMARELQTSLSYAAGATGSEPAGDVLLVGGGALTPGLPERLGQLMGCEARAVHLAELALAPRHIAAEAISSSMVVAAGLALDDSRAPAVEVAA